LCVCQAHRPLTQPALTIATARWPQPDQSLPVVRPGTRSDTRVLRGPYPWSNDSFCQKAVPGGEGCWRLPVSFEPPHDGRQFVCGSEESRGRDWDDTTRGVRKIGDALLTIPESLHKHTSARESATRRDRNAHGEASSCSQRGGPDGRSVVSLVQARARANGRRLRRRHFVPCI